MAEQVKNRVKKPIKKTGKKIKFVLAFCLWIVYTNKC